MSTNKTATARTRRIRTGLSLVTAIVLALLAVFATRPAYAQPPAWDAADLEAFLDPIIAHGMARTSFSLPHPYRQDAVRSNAWEGDGYAPLDAKRQRQIFAFQRTPPLAVAIVAALWLASGLAAVALAGTVPVWRKRTWPAWGRWLYTAFAVLAVAFVPFLSYWNLLGFRW